MLEKLSFTDNYNGQFMLYDKVFEVLGEGKEELLRLPDLKIHCSYSFSADGQGYSDFKISFAFDEDDVFMGSPKSKFFDIIYNANRNLVELELEVLIERMACMEILFAL